MANAMNLCFICGELHARLRTTSVVLIHICNKRWEWVWTGPFRQDLLGSCRPSSPHVGGPLTSMLGVANSFSVLPYLFAYLSSFLDLSRALATREGNGASTICRRPAQSSN